MRIHELMTRNVITVAPDTPVTRIVSLLAGQAISGVPVVDGDRLIGVISEADLLMREKPLHTPAAIAFLGAILMVESQEKTYEEFRRHAGATARDIMSSPVVTISPDMEVAEAAQIMLDRNINRLPVVEGDRMVGILTRKDLVRALLG
jgi:CBS domain-containing protein